MPDRPPTLPPLTLEALRALLQPQALALVEELNSPGKEKALKELDRRLVHRLEHSGLVKSEKTGMVVLSEFGQALITDITKLAPTWEKKGHAALAAATEWGEVTAPPPPEVSLEWGKIELADFVTSEQLIDFEVLTGPESGSEVEFGTVREPLYEVIWGAVLNAAQKGETMPLPRPRKPVAIPLRAAPAELLEGLALPASVVVKALAHLKAGRNLLLVGPPATGKTTLARRLAATLCGGDNFTQVEAQPQWATSDLLGWLEQDEKGRAHFEEGVAAKAARKCEESVVNGDPPRPHYLLIDNFERADMDLAFGKLFTVFEYRELLPLLTSAESRGRPYLMPPEFRLIATYDTATSEGDTSLQMGFALRRRFAFLELPLPDPEAEAKVLLASAQPNKTGELARLAKFAAALRRHYPLGTGYLVESVKNPGKEALDDVLAERLAPVWPLLGRPALRELAATAKGLWGEKSPLVSLLESRGEGRSDIFEALAQV